MKTHKTSSSPAKPHKGAGEIRIIGGQWRRTKLPVPLHTGLRPTPDRVRETLFNWLGQSLVGWHCVDAFAGSGALGLEAASRGASHVQLCEVESVLVAHLADQVKRLNATSVQVRKIDGVLFLHQTQKASCDLIFIDPPFSGDLFEPALMAAKQALKQDGYIYLEAPKEWLEESLAPLGLSIYRHLKAGAVHAHLLQRLA